MMHQVIECRLCRHIEVVDGDDADASVAKVVRHVATNHGYDPRLLRGAVRLRTASSQQVADCANPECDHDRTIPRPGCELRATEATDQQIGEQ